MSYYPKDSGGASAAGRHYHQAPLTAAAAVPPPAKQQRQTTRRQQQRSSNTKSQPFDADDLRRRLYVVLAEQESSRQEKRYSRMEAVAAKAREARNNHNAVDGLPISAAAIAKSDDGEEEDETTTEGDELVEVKRASVGSCYGSSATANNNTTTAPYRHVPQVAASQFVRTTTTETVNNKRMHALSYSALHVHTDGGGLIERATNNSSSNNDDNKFNGNKLQSKRSLKRVQSQRDNHHIYYERNQQLAGQQFQYQNPRFVENCMAAAAGTDSSNRQSRHSMMIYGKPSFGDLSSPTNMNMNNMYTCRSRSVPLEDYCYSMDGDRDDPAATDIFVPDLATVGEHQRVDWTQSDEIHRQQQIQHEQQRSQQYHENGDQKRRSSLSKLHKVESIWTLKAKLGNLIRHHHKDERPVATIIHEEEVSPSTTTTASASSAAGSSPKPARRGFLGRFRR
ncbi:hypothetical protein SLS62_005690 [Diatrype stigma]|uniref:Uncharacterized protein n=1 Tax=Diatrype stigma TaxID=117547 RepID=A0AAN9V005_9PEZI